MRIEKRSLLNFIILSLPFTNLTIFRMGNFRGLVVPEIIIFVFIIFNIKTVLNVKKILLILFLAFIPLLWFMTIISLSDFLNTYLSTLFYFIFLICSFKQAKSIRILKDYIISVKILIYYGFIQCITYIVAPQFFYNNLFSIFGNLSLTQNDISYYGDFIRVNSLYYEPSIYALMCLVGFALCLSYDKVFNTYDKTITAIGVILSFSASSIVGLVIILIVYVFKNIKFSKKKLLLLFPSIIVFCFYTFLKIIFPRLNEINTVGTSGFYRISAPIKIVENLILSQYPFGIALGQINPYLSIYKFDFLYKAGSGFGTSIDSVPFIIIFHTGILSIILFYFAIKGFMYKYKTNQIYLILSIIVYLFSTGNFNFFYFPCIIVVLICSKNIGVINIKT